MCVYKNKIRHIQYDRDSVEDGNITFSLVFVIHLVAHTDTKLFCVFNLKVY